MLLFLFSRCYFSFGISGWGDWQVFAFSFCFVFVKGYVVLVLVGCSFCFVGLCLPMFWGLSCVRFYCIFIVEVLSGIPHASEVFITVWEVYVSRVSFAFFIAI